MATKFSSTQIKYLVNRLKEEADKLIKVRCPYYSKWNKSNGLTTEELIEFLKIIEKASISKDYIIDLLQNGRSINIETLFPEIQIFREAKDKELSDYIDTIETAVQKFEDTIMLSGDKEEFDICLKALAAIK